MKQIIPKAILFNRVALIKIIIWTYENYCDICVVENTKGVKTNEYSGVLPSIYRQRGPAEFP